MRKNRKSVSWKLTHMSKKHIGVSCDNRINRMSVAEMFVMQANINIELEKRISDIEDRLQKIEEKQKEDILLFCLAVKTHKNILRNNIRQLVNSYSSSKNVSQRDVWHSIYSQLYYLYHISIRNYKKGKGETNLDVAEKNNFLDKIFNIISNMVRELK